ncbi:uncharacterized protein Hen1 [Linepithema humile]|uniref:uncharacterized protein Hen1 n=1 Tax=Linepithema humile TaxID=83485 RepID=UPI00062338DB|nr:PREDICTED: uncharacterized protein LOC105679398 [Linepithema humile]
MIIVLFHLFYLLGKYVYKTYRLKKLKALCDAAKDNTESSESYEMLDEISVSSEDLSAPKSNEVLKFSPPAYIQRYNAVVDVLMDPRYQGKVRKVVDFGCAELSFLVYLKNLAGVEEILCVDVDKELLERHQGRAKPLISEYLCSRNTPLLIEVCEGSVTHNDRKLEKTDAVICIELIEHLYPDTLMDLPFNIFGYIMPKVVAITTPNADFNVLFSNFSGYRHPDHKFEWTRQQFQDWAQNIVVRYPCYDVTFHDICNGPEGTEEYGACTQMAVFHRLSLIEECNQISGVDGLFKRVCRYDYPVNIDTRSDEQKILDEATYYINFLSFKKDEYTEEVSLSDVVSYMEKCYTVTTEALRTILVDAGWTVQDRDDGPVILNSQSTNSSNDEMDLDIIDDVDFTNEGDEWNVNYEPGPPTSADEKSVYMSHSSYWSEEPSIVIPENRSIIHENTYLFDGVNSFTEHQEEHQVAEEPHTTHDISNLRVNTVESSVFAERELPSNSISLALDETEMDARAEIIDSSTSSVLAASSVTSNSSLKLEDTTKNLSADNITIENPPQDDEILRIMHGSTSMFNFQPPLCVSRSSTSPEPLFFHSDFNNSLQNDSANDQNESYSNQCLLNSTFQSEAANEAAMSIKESTLENTFELRKRSLPREDKINFFKYTRSNYSKVNKDLEQDDIASVKSEAFKNNDIAAVSSNVYSSNFNNQPRYTSSPRAKVPNSHRHTYLDCEELMPATNSSLSATEAIKETILNTDNNLLQNTSQECNASAETIKLCTSLNSDVINTSEYNVDCLASNNIQQELCLESKEFNCIDKSISAELTQGTNEELAEKTSIINYETDVVDDVQSVDTHHVLSLDSENIKHKNENAHCTLAAAKPNSIDDRAHLEDAISDLAESNASKGSLSPLRELLSFKLQSDNKRSFECAKETSILENDKFVPFKSNKDTSNIQLTSAVLKSEESVSTSRDVNIAGLVNNVEAKSSPLETPPNSWSPEIMDSGYPNSASAQDITPEYDLSSIAQDHIPDSESPSVAEAPRLGVLEPIEVENGDLANNNRDDEGNNMMAVDANDIENLQPLIDVLENDLENENDIYVMQNGFPIWLLRILDMANPLDFDVQARQNLRVPDELADGANYVGHDEGFDSSSSENESDIAYNETENDNEHGE